jgi:NTP pyrophosphatase (non-canonical NTP hydrolase)
MSEPAEQTALQSIVAERHRQDQCKAEGRFRFVCADSAMGNHERLTCLAEEVGEVAEAVLTLDGLAQARARGLRVGDSAEHLRTELTQVAAICLAWLESECNSSPIVDYTPDSPAVDHAPGQGAADGR